MIVLVGGKEEEEEGGKRLTLYGAYHFARRVLPLVFSSGQSFGKHFLPGRSMGEVGDRSDILPVLDQDERQHHLYDRPVIPANLYPVGTASAPLAEPGGKFTEMRAGYSRRLGYELNLGKSTFVAFCTRTSSCVTPFLDSVFSVITYPFPDCPVAVSNSIHAKNTRRF